MKYLKMLGLAAVAAVAMMAFVGTASATVLCQNNTEPCTSVYPKGTTLSSSLKPGTSSGLKAGFAYITCTTSSQSGSTANAGGAAETVRGLPATWTTEGCNATLNVLKMGELEIHHISGTSAGTLTAKGSEITVYTNGVHCIYGPAAGGSDIGKLTGSSESGATATIKVESQMTRLMGGFLCASPALWTAEYVVTTPDFLNVKGS
jgi:hypothetical protein